MATSRAFFFFFTKGSFQTVNLRSSYHFNNAKHHFLSKAVCVIVSCYKVKSNVYGLWFHLPRYEDVWSHKHAMETKNRNKTEPFKNDNKNIQISSDNSKKLQ